MIDKFDNASISKDPYTGKTNQNKLNRISEKLAAYDAGNYKPSELKLDFLKLGNRGGVIGEKKLQQYATNNPDVQANTFAKMAKNAGVTLKGGGDITAQTVRGYRKTPETGAAASAPATQTENQVLDAQEIIDSMQTMLADKFSQPAQPDFAALLRGITESQNSMFANMMNNNRIQQSQMNPMRMSPVLGIRSAGMQNYGLNNATNAFGRDGTRFGGLKNNSLNLF